MGRIDDFRVCMANSEQCEQTGNVMGWKLARYAQEHLHSYVIIINITIIIILEVEVAMTIILVE